MVAEPDTMFVVVMASGSVLVAMVVVSWESWDVGATDDFVTTDVTGTAEVVAIITVPVKIMVSPPLVTVVVTATGALVVVKTMNEVVDCEDHMLDTAWLAEEVADADGTTVRVVVVVMMAVSVDVVPAETVVDVYVTGTVEVTVKGVVMATIAVAVEVVVTAIVPVVQVVDFTVVVEPYKTVVVVTVAKAEVVRAVVVMTGTSEVVLMATVTPLMVVLDPGTDGAVVVL